MLSHIVIFWTDPKQPGAARKLIAATKEYLAKLPGVLSFHVGTPVPSPREVVDGSYQVAMNIQLADKAAEIAYQEHPRHKEFSAACAPLFTRVKVYDFEG